MLAAHSQDARPLGRWGFTLADVLPAAALLAFSQAAAFGQGAAVKAPALAVVALAIAWRRRALGICLLGVLTGATAANLLGHRAITCGVVLPALMLVSYCLGAAEPTPRLLAGLAGVLGVCGLESLIDPRLDPSFVVVLVPLMLAIAAAGAIVRSHRAMSSELERCTLELEQRREQRAQLAVSLERSRVGAEMNSVVTGGVGQMVNEAWRGLSHVREDPKSARESFAAIESAGRRVLGDMRGLVGVLRADDDGHAPQPTMADLGRLLAQLRDRGLQVMLSSEGTQRSLAPGVDVSAYRILEDALALAARSDERAALSIHVRYRARELELEVRGLPVPAFDRVRSEQAHGGGPHVEGSLADELVSLRERVALHAGRLRTDRGPGGARTLRVWLPLAGAQS